MSEDIPYIQYNRSNITFARQNRKNGTEAEEKMRTTILQKRPLGYKFTRQKPLGPFIADFYCAKLLLCIEIDGDSHTTKKEYDQERDEFLAKHKIQTMRFTNDEVLNTSNQVEKEIEIYIQERQKKPTP